MPVVASVDAGGVVDAQQWWWPSIINTGGGCRCLVMVVVDR